jgi:hypothetical protein
LSVTGLSYPHSGQNSTDLRVLERASTDPTDLVLGSDEHVVPGSEEQVVIAGP